jgi:hypothetical protein
MSFSSFDRVVIDNIIKFLHPIYASILRSCSKQLREFVTKPPRRSPNQLLIEAAAIGDIYLCKLALSRGASNYELMLRKFRQTRNIASARFALDLLEKRVDAPKEGIDDELWELFRLIGLVGDKEMLLRAKGLIEKIVAIDWIHGFQSSTPGYARSLLEKKFIPTMIEGAAESGRLDVCEAIGLKIDRSVEFMIRGGALSDSVAVCKRAIDLGASVSCNEVKNAALDGSFDVFAFLLDRYVSTAMHQNYYVKRGIEENIRRGRDSVKKFDYLLSVLRSVGERLDWKVPSPDEILYAASRCANVELCRYAKEKGAIDLSLIYDNGLNPITKEILELGIEWGVDVNKCLCEISLKYSVAEYDKSSDPLPVKRENRKKELDIVSQLYHLLHEHGYRQYDDMLRQAVWTRSRELVETVIEWGKNDLYEGDEGFERFTWHRLNLPDTPKKMAACFPDDLYAEPTL